MEQPKKFYCQVGWNKARREQCKEQCHDCKRAVEHRQDKTRAARERIETKN